MSRRVVYNNKYKYINGTNLGGLRKILCKPGGACGNYRAAVLRF
jgi:hypothetical protein